MPDIMTKQELLQTIEHVEEFLVSLKREITEDNAKYFEIDVAETRDIKPVYPMKMMDVTSHFPDRVTELRQIGPITYTLIVQDFTMDNRILGNRNS